MSDVTFAVTRKHVSVNLLTAEDPVHGRRHIGLPMRTNSDVGESNYYRIFIFAYMKTFYDIIR